MNKLMLKTIAPIIFSMALLFLVGCDVTAGKEVIVKNSTAENVSVIKVEFSQNIEIEPTKTVIIYIDSNAEGFDLEVIWKGETYIGNTGYIQDPRKVTIELLEDMNCKITAHGKYTGGTHFVQLEK